MHDLVGGAVARALTIGGRELHAQEALAVRLVGEVVAADALRDATEVVAARVCAAPRNVLIRTKAKALRRAGFDPRAPTPDL